MTEQEWLTCANPQRMREFLRDKSSERKLQLLALACCRRIEPLLPNEQSKAVINALERYIEGQSTAEGLAEARRIAAESYFDEMTKANDLAFAAVVMMGDSVVDTMMTAAEATAWVKVGTPDAISELEEREQANLLRDIFGNPFRPTVVAGSVLAWNDECIVHLAKGIYEERAFDRLPILAGALEEAGCTDADILNHCRQPGEHVRGCWVVDLLLGKS
jgi:hypothetical protein